VLCAFSSFRRLLLTGPTRRDPSEVGCPDVMVVPLADKRETRCDWVSSAAQTKTGSFRQTLTPQKMFSLDVHYVCCYEMRDPGSRRQRHDPKPLLYKDVDLTDFASMSACIPCCRLTGWV